LQCWTPGFGHLFCSGHGVKIFIISIVTATPNSLTQQ
jgi:hypothetical protein